MNSYHNIATIVKQNSEDGIQMASGLSVSVARLFIVIFR